MIAVSALAVAAFVLSLYGRFVFMRACQQPPRSWRALLRVPVAPFISYLYLALLIQLALVLFCATVVAVPLIVMLAGVAAAASVDPLRPGILRTPAGLAPYLRDGRVLMGILCIFVIAFVTVMINLALLVRGVIWAAGAMPELDPMKWNAVLTDSSRAALSIIAAAVAVLEPFFLTALHLHADRVRSRSSGEDLIRRFRASIGKAAAAVALVSLLIAVPGEASAREMTSHDYVQQLRVIHQALSEGRFDDVSHADSLDSTVVMHGSARFEPDHALLRAARTAAAQERTDQAVLGRLAATIDAFAIPPASSPAASPDALVLERVKRREKAGELVAGGRLDELPALSPSVAQEIIRIFGRITEWLTEQLERLYDWLVELWPDGDDDPAATTSFLGVSVAVWVATLAIVTLLVSLATYVVRRSRRHAAVRSSAPAAAVERDADPRSRESNEWERYAAELAAAGRLREAIRAWYHAVLSTLYRGGILHYRKGVTNWEYVGVLSPAIPWRPHFISMTRTFDREWYGRVETSPESLESLASDARAILRAMREGGR